MYSKTIAYQIFASRRIFKWKMIRYIWQANDNDNENNEDEDDDNDNHEVGDGDGGNDDGGGGDKDEDDFKDGRALLVGKRLSI